MTTVADRLRAISRLQPPGKRIHEENRERGERFATKPDGRTGLDRNPNCNNGDGKHPWRAPIPRRVAKRAIQKAKQR